MSESEFEGVFDEDYLHFYETFLAERTPAETERFVVRGGRAARMAHFTVRWFTVPELRSWLEEAGFENVRTPGLTAETRLVVVADRSSASGPG